MPTTTETEHRASAAERHHELAMAAINRPTPEFKVELTWNAKGDTQVNVAGSGSNLGTLGSAVETEYDRLREKYPRGNGAA